MSNELITKDNERIKEFFSSLDRMLDKFEKVITHYKPMLNGDRFLTDLEASEKLKVSRRTLQQYGQKVESPISILEVKPCIGNLIFRKSWRKTIISHSCSFLGSMSTIKTKFPEAIVLNFGELIFS